ncbi:pyridoxamine 5'-phosphate oxidase family protein [Mucilaginibacter sp. UR6-11]|uniref:pyridoxamine 5'-phosphate oxidase family protein n=1 Tax=Mucilaginibacter sp. UR6-11 TaxID=1435644 RepID=UPI001E531F75|nr:pyridoxamine 5'-phosphate oxidase family protein [Mucilaginibacter sp. UR6-11]MCC8425509.1 pyridoxamine 5'-phosphate oxidase family protein [Mucilaginibacter sp. UR6-11]
MLGELNTTMLEDLLSTQLLGRIGCHADGITYIIPVNYVYEAPYIYAHSADGLKVSLMRKNPEVCFEVDRVENFFNWQSAVCWGTFEEITGVKESEQAMQKLIDRIEPYLSKAEDAHPSHGIADRASEIGTSKRLVLYRILLNKKTGRFEQRDAPPAETQEA